MEIPHRLSKRDEELAKQFGGADLEDYQTPQERPYFDKFDHAQRSIYHQPNHLSFWNQEEHGNTTNNQG
jgi:hypothetical protein